MQTDEREFTAARRNSDIDRTINNKARAKRSSQKALHIVPSAQMRNIGRGPGLEDLGKVYNAVSTNGLLFHSPNISVTE